VITRSGALYFLVEKRLEILPITGEEKTCKRFEAPKMLKKGVGKKKNVDANSKRTLLC